MAEGLEKGKDFDTVSDDIYVTASRVGVISCLTKQMMYNFCSVPERVWYSRKKTKERSRFVITLSTACHLNDLESILDEFQQCLEDFGVTSEEFARRLDALDIGVDLSKKLKERIRLPEQGINKVEKMDITMKKLDSYFSEKFSQATTIIPIVDSSNQPSYDNIKADVERESVAKVDNIVGRINAGDNISDEDSREFAKSLRTMPELTEEKREELSKRLTKATAIYHGGKGNPLTLDLSTKGRLKYLYTDLEEQEEGLGVPGGPAQN